MRELDTVDSVANGVIVRYEPAYKDRELKGADFTLCLLK